MVWNLQKKEADHFQGLIKKMPAINTVGIIKLYVLSNPTNESPHHRQQQRPPSLLQTLWGEDV